MKMFILSMGIIILVMPILAMSMPEIVSKLADRKKKWHVILSFLIVTIIVAVFIGLQENYFFFQQ